MITNVLSTGEQYFKAIKANKIIKILNINLWLLPEYTIFFIVYAPVAVKNFN